MLVLRSPVAFKLGDPGCWVCEAGSSAAVCQGMSERPGESHLCLLGKLQNHYSTRPEDEECPEAWESGVNCLYIDGNHSSIDSYNQSGSPSAVTPAPVN